MLYNTRLSLHNNNILISPWIKFVKNSLDELGMSEYFVNQKVDNMFHFKSLVKSRLHDQFVQQWFSSVDTSPKCIVYRMYKKDYCFEKFLDILPINLAKVLCKFRIMNHSLPIEKGRYFNIE